MIEIPGNDRLNRPLRAPRRVPSASPPRRARPRPPGPPSAMITGSGSRSRRSPSTSRSRRSRRRSAARRRAPSSRPRRGRRPTAAGRPAAGARTTEASPRRTGDSHRDPQAVLLGAPAAVAGDRREDDDRHRGRSRRPQPPAGLGSARPSASAVSNIEPTLGPAPPPRIGRRVEPRGACLHPRVTCRFDPRADDGRAPGDQAPGMLTSTRRWPPRGAPPVPSSGRRGRRPAQVLRRRTSRSTASTCRPPRRGPRTARAQRRRQDHARRDPRGPPPRRRRPGLRSSRRSGAPRARLPSPVGMVCRRARRSRDHRPRGDRALQRCLSEPAARRRRR